MDSLHRELERANEKLNDVVRTLKDVQDELRGDDSTPGLTERIRVLESWRTDARTFQRDIRVQLYAGLVALAGAVLMAIWKSVHP